MAVVITPTGELPPCSPVLEETRCLSQRGILLSTAFKRLLGARLSRHIRAFVGL